MKGNREDLVMKFVHECNNINCDKIIEFDYLKRFEQRAGRTIKLRKSDSTHGFLLHINIGLSVDSNDDTMSQEGVN